MLSEHCSVFSAHFYVDFYRKGCVRVCLEMPTAVPAWPPGSTRPLPATDTKKHSHVHTHVRSHQEPSQTRGSYRAVLELQVRRRSSTCAVLNRQKSGRRCIPAQLGWAAVEMSQDSTEPDPQRGVGDKISMA